MEKVWLDEEVRLIFFVRGGRWKCRKFFQGSSVSLYWVAYLEALIFKGGVIGYESGVRYVECRVEVCVCIGCCGAKKV